MARLVSTAGVSLIAFWSCASVEVTPVPGVSAAPKDRGCQVELYAVRPDRAYEELGTVRAVPASVNPDAHQLQQMIREKACTLGADAIVDVHEVLVADAPGKVMIGTAVRYK